MTYFSQNPISPPTPFGTSPPRNPREAVDAIMAYLDREAAGTAMPRAPFAPFLAETYEPPGGGGEGGYAPAAAPFAQNYESVPFGVEEEEPEALLPHPDPRTDDERIENVLWLLERNPSELPASRESDEATPFGLANLFGLIGSANAQARGGWGKPPSVRLDLETLAPEELPLPELPPSPQDLFRRRTYNLARKTVQALEPNNPLLKSNPLPDRVPTVAEIEAMEAEERAAVERARQAGTFKAKRGGETKHTITGQVAHHEKALEAKPPYEANVRIGNGYADRLRVDKETNSALIIEDKPDNLRAIARGKRQGAGYARNYERQTGRRTTYAVETYDPVKFVRRMLGYE